MGKVYEDSPDSDLQTVLGEREVPPFSAMDFDGDEPAPNVDWKDIPKLTEEEAAAINDPYHGHYQEFNQKFIEKMYNITDEDKKRDEEKSHTMDILYQSVEPKFKHFRPPFTIKIFKWEVSMMWAYRIVKACLLKDCYPTSMGISSENKSDKEIKTYLDSLADGLKDPMGDSIAHYHGLVDQNSQLPEGMEVIHISQKDEEPQDGVTKEEVDNVDNRVNMAIHAKDVTKELFEELAADDEEGDSKEIVLEFQCTPIKNVVIDRIAEDLLKQYQKIGKED